MTLRQIVILVIVLVAVLQRSDSLHMDLPEPKHSLMEMYEKLNAKAAAQSDQDVRELCVLIQATTIGSSLPDSFTKRFVRAQQQFLRGERAAVTSQALADAVNQLGRRLNAAVYTGTNELQLNLLRKSECPKLRVLLACPAEGEPDPHALPPAGAVYLGFFLLRQKLTNPAWFGNPDEQNKAWNAFEANRPKGEQKYGYRVSVEPEPAEATEFRFLMRTASTHRHSKPAIAFEKFLDDLGY